MTLSPATAASVAEIGSLWWIGPARLIGRFRPSLGAATSADERMFARWPPAMATWGLPALAVVVALVPSVFHALASDAATPGYLDWTRVWIVDIYTESFPFMLAALLLGILSPALAVVLVLAFAGFDLTAAFIQPRELQPLPFAVIGRLVSYWLLWLLAVEVPLVGRVLAEPRIGGAQGRLLGAAVGAAATGGFALLWTIMASVLIRAPHTLSHLFGPQPAAVYPLQTSGWQIAAIGAVAAGAAIAARGPGRTLATPPNPVRGWEHPIVRAVRHVLVAAALTVCLWGIITTPWHAAVLFGALVLARPIGVVVAGAATRAGLARQLPAAAAVAASVVAAMVVALVVVPPIDVNSNTWDRFVIGLAVVVVVAEIAAAVMSRPPGAPAPHAAVGAALGLLWLQVLTLTLPLSVFADNCADPQDCFNSWYAAALAAGATGAMLAARRLKDVNWDFGKDSWDWAQDKVMQTIGFGYNVKKRMDAIDAKNATDYMGSMPYAAATEAWSRCVLTSACVNALGKPDDCHELQMLRRLRDEYLRGEPRGAEVIDDYYRTSPLVVSAIESGGGGLDTWQGVYAEFVEPVVALVDADRFKEAADEFLARYGAIKARYGVA